jgi:hypothetical protein
MAQGQIFRANASNQPAWSTATYPNTATGTGTILIADGTNWVASTATYPTTAGDSGNVLTSNGTNFTSTANPIGTLKVVELVITSAQIKALVATPITLIAAPGSGKTISLVSVTRYYNYGGTNVFVAGAAQAINLSFDNTTTIIAAVSNALLVGTSDSQIALSPTGVALAASVSQAENKAITISNSTATEITGNAANDNSIKITALYYVVSAP